LAFGNSGLSESKASSKKSEEKKKKKEKSERRKEGKSGERPCILKKKVGDSTFSRSHKAERGLAKDRTISDRVRKLEGKVGVQPKKRSSPT